MRIITIAVLLLAGAAAQAPKHGTDAASSIIERGRDWELLGQGYQLTADSTVDPQGNVYFTDARHNRIYKVDPQGKIALWKQESGGAHGVAFGRDGRLYAGQHDRKRIVALSPDGRESVIAEGVQTHHLVTTARHEIYFADAPNHRIWFIGASGNRRVVNDALVWPHSLRVSADQSLLAVTDLGTRWVWTFRIQRDGSLAAGRQFCQLDAAGETAPDAAGLAFDTSGFLYVGTTLGVQVCDLFGRVVAIIEPPGKEGLSDVFFAGPDLHWLYVADGDRLYRRFVKVRGSAR